MLVSKLAPYSEGKERPKRQVTTDRQVTDLISKELTYENYLGSHKMSRSHLLIESEKFI